MSLHPPAEWSPHRAIWLGFPSHAELWEDNLAAAQAETAALARALAGPGGERVKVLASGGAALARARSLCGDAAEVRAARFGDVWLRDTGPIFHGGAATAFRFNGWGGKYVLEGDETVAAEIAADAGAELSRRDFVLEGGALDHDGEGTVLTTRECLLNPNRNRNWTEAVAEDALRRSIGAAKVIWLPRGLLGDHTDGHVDNLARFVGPAAVAIPIALGADDPHAEVYDDAAKALAGAADALGRRLQVMRVPSPGRVLGADRQPAPASHMNFIVANRAVVFPTYGAAAAALARRALEDLFAGREVIGLPSQALLTGGGSFHCISCQAPL